MPWYIWPIILIALPFLLAILVVCLVSVAITRVSLYLLVWILWCPRGRNVLYVYSDSPVWKEHIERTILPQLSDSVIVLNWSHRKRWSPSLARAVFRHFGGGREFNPLALVFKPFHRQIDFRFWKAFRAWKKGKVDDLERMEREFLLLLNDLGQLKGEQTGRGNE